MTPKIPLKRVLFLDIETAPQYPDYDLLPDILKKHWTKKMTRIHRSPIEEEAPDPKVWYPLRAGIFSEFAKVICITLGIVPDIDAGQIRLKSIYGDDERELLLSFIELINKHYPSSDNSWLCGHNIKEFDIPFLCRRMVVHRLPLPNILQISGKKPWELNYLLDTMEMWKFGDYKHYTSLDLLATILDIPSPKDDIDGSDVGRVYWEENDLERIVTYCEKDVRTVARVYLRLQGMSDLAPSNEEEE